MIILELLDVFTNVADGSYFDRLVSNYNELIRKRISKVNQVKIFCETHNEKSQDKSSITITLDGVSYRLSDSRVVTDFMKELAVIDDHILVLKRLLFSHKISNKSAADSEKIKTDSLMLQLLVERSDTGLCISIGEKKQIYIVKSIEQKRHLILRTIDNFCIKIYREEKFYRNELLFLRKLQDASFSPDLIDYDNDALAIITPWYGDVEECTDMNIEQELEAFIPALSKYNVSHNDLKFPDEVKFYNGKLKIIDWEHATEIGGKFDKSRYFIDKYINNVFWLLNSNNLVGYLPCVIIANSLDEIENMQPKNTKIIAAYKIFDLVSKPEFANFISHLTAKNDRALDLKQEVYVSFVLRKDALLKCQQCVLITDFDEIKTVLYKQAIYADDYLIRMWDCWMQKNKSPFNN